jgi:hypothetical protein
VICGGLTFSFLYPYFTDPYSFDLVLAGISILIGAVLIWNVIHYFLMNDEKRQAYHIKREAGSKFAIDLNKKYLITTQTYDSLWTPNQVQRARRSN